MYIHSCNYVLPFKPFFDEAINFRFDNFLRSTLFICFRLPPPLHNNAMTLT